MAVGKSGRIVIEVDPELKQELYRELRIEGKVLKQWFVENAEAFLQERQQPSLFDTYTQGSKDEAQSS